MPFYFPYWGNKEEEICHIIPYINFDKYDIICECFGGSLAFSRYVFSKHPNKRFLCSDADKNLTLFCNEFHKNKMKIVEDVIKQMTFFIDDKEGYLKYIKNIPNDTYDLLKHTLFYNTMYQVRKGMYPPKERIYKFMKYDEKTTNLDNFFKEVEYKCIDVADAINKVINDTRALVFLDPPYPIKSDDSGYAENNIDHIWKSLIEFTRTCSCDFILIVEKNVILEELFKPFIIGEYQKQYKVSRGKGNKVKKPYI
jgi:site-specific DNA-adenine methylase